MSFIPLVINATMPFACKSLEEMVTLDRLRPSDLDHDLDAANLRNVVVHASLVELNLVDEVLVFLSGLLLAGVMLNKDGRFDLTVEFLVLDLVASTLEFVHSLFIEPSFGL